MTEAERKRVSKFLSLVLRHKPETIGINLDEQGWASTRTLLTKAHYKNLSLSMEQLKEVVETNDKKRFSFSEDYSKIRANQGHSLQVDLGLLPQEPPEILYHGTAVRNLPFIMKEGIQKRNRQHVHLSPDVPTAEKVGSRHGQPVVLQIRAAEMSRAGKKFFLSENGVWLTDEVTPDYIKFPI